MKLYKSIGIVGLLIIFAGISASVYVEGDKVADSTSMVMVSHSEYMSGETGQIIGKLYNYKGDPILANCSVTIYNPDKSVYLAPTLTDDTLEASDGTHYINFTTPTVEGVYEYQITCDFVNNNKPMQRTISNSFHLSPALNLINTVNASASSIYSIVTDIQANMFSDIDAYNNFTAIDLNFQVVNGKLDDISNNITALKSYCDATTNSSNLCQLVWATNQKTIDIENTLNTVVVAKLDVINQTTWNTYDYMTGTLASNINTILGSLTNIQNGVSQINATVNRIETNVTTIISNQEDVVYIDVTS